MSFVLPAYAGMILPSPVFAMESLGAPRVCGDDPELEANVNKTVACSPRMRG